MLVIPSGEELIIPPTLAYSTLATQFDGSTERVTLSTFPAIGTSDFTITAWTKVDTTGYAHPIIMGAGSLGAGEWMFRCTNVSGSNVQLAMYANSGGLNLSTPNIFSTAGDQWALMSVTRTAGVTQLWVNGVASGASNPGPADDLNTAVTAALGGLAAGGRHYKGLLDEIGFWDRGLTGPELLEVYGSGYPSALSDHSAYANTSYWWKMGEGDDATTIYDNKGSVDGTLVNMDAGNYVSDTPP